MFRLPLVIYIVLITIPFLGSSAHAVVIHYDLYDVYFVHVIDSGHATGSFEYDTVTRSVSKVTIHTTETSIWPALTYTDGDIYRVYTNELFLKKPTDLDNYADLVLKFEDPLGFARIDITPVLSYEHIAAGNVLISDVHRYVNFNGWLYGTVVPVPSAVWLFGSGLLGLIGLARRKKS